MSKNSTSEPKNSTECPNNGDVWDDTLLIKAYNSSVKLASEELAKRIARATNSSQQQTTDGSSKSPELEATENLVYSVGGYVRATFDDGCDYEAKILSINAENETCLLKYIGYENEQEVRLADLLPSWGKKARRLQFARAKQDAAEGVVEENGQSKGKGSGNGNGTKKKSGSQREQDFGFGALPPQPPMPPMLAQNLEDSEHLSTMLMSWYMSGYYTGVYQGIQIAKAKVKGQK